MKKHRFTAGLCAAVILMAAVVPAFAQETGSIAVPEAATQAASETIAEQPASSEETTASSEEAAVSSEAEVPANSEAEQPVQDIDAGEQVSEEEAASLALASSTLTSIDGVYQIGTADELKQFADLVNGGETAADAKLTADIDLSTVCSEALGSWTPIGKSLYDEDNWDTIDTPYIGSFDGNGFKISNLYVNIPDETETETAALFGMLGTGGEIKNLTVDGTVHGSARVAGICAYSDGGNIINCTNNASITSDYMAGGICSLFKNAAMKNCVNNGSVTGRYNVGGMASIIMSCEITACINNGTIAGNKNYAGGICGHINLNGNIAGCINTGNVSSENSGAGGIVGWYELGSVTDCMNIAQSITAPKAVGGIVGRTYSTEPNIVNCFYDSDLFDSDAIGLFDGDLAALLNVYGAPTINFTCGQIAFMLNRDVEGYSFYQNILCENADAYPTLDATHGKVYQVRTKKCDGSDDDIYIFSNSETVERAPHIYDKGVCINCGSAASDYMTPVDGVYQIETAAQLKWFAAYVNTVDSAVSAKLMNDIDLSSVCSEARGSWTPIGNTASPYAGTFDGNGKTVSGLYINEPKKTDRALFGRLGSGKIIELTVSGTVTGGLRTAGICGSNLNGSIESCVNNADVTGDSIVGGVCAFNYKSIISCVNNGNITGGMVTGGVIGGSRGNEDGTKSYVYYGVNNGSVSGTEHGIGGVIGWVQNTRVFCCTNNGSVSGGAASAGTGGVVGGIESGSIERCINITADISGADSVGAICGGLVMGFDIIKICYYDSTLYKGEALGEYPDGYEAYVSDVGGKTTEEFKSGEICYTLTRNVHSTYYQNLGGDNADTYPVTDNTHSYVSRQKAYNTCIPSDDFTYFYSNGYNDTYAEHTYADGICTYCGAGLAGHLTPVDGVYQIGTAHELKWFAGYVNFAESGANAVLTADIDLSSVCSEALGSWMPIGHNIEGYSEKSSFTGTFDGAGHTVSGLYINAPNEGEQGLFGRIDIDGMVKNLTVNGSVTANYGVGGIAGASQGHIEGCTSNVIVNGESYVGGITGASSSSLSPVSIIGCVNNGTVTGTNSVGGITGSTGTSEVGGKVVPVNIDGCTNNGVVTGYSAGGICAMSFGATLTNDVNNGNVISTSTKEDSDSGTVGGICGYMQWGSMTNCLNTAPITSEFDAGGICSYAQWTVITNCYFDSTVFNGAAIADDDASTITDVFGKTTSELASGEVCWLLNGGKARSADAWHQTLGADTYPTLSTEHNNVVLTNGKYLNTASITVTVDAQQAYTGSEVKPQPQISTSAQNFTASDYVVTYANNINEGTATLTVSPSADGHFTFDAQSAQFNITKAPVYYTLTFETNGGSAVAAITQLAGTGVSLDGISSAKNGYTFDGWYLDAALTVKAQSITLAGSMTVYAKWTAVPTPAQPNDITSGTIAKTGDDSPIGIWIALMLVSAGAAAAIIIYIKVKKRS